MPLPPQVELTPLPGPQYAFAASLADIAIYGGAAGGGKSHGLLLECARNIDNPTYRGAIFRKSYPQIMAGGGLWDAAAKIYPSLGGRANQSKAEYRFDSGAVISFRHLQHETTVHDWQGAELAFIGFDELTHFSMRQFFYMASRNRSTSGIRPYIRATCNPDAGSWVAAFIAWWIDPDSGYPIPERAGVLRWFYRVGDDIDWYDSPEEAMAAHPDLADDPPKSVTFIPAKLSDNAVLCAKDPGYRANLKALSWVERAQLLDGNWKVTAADGMFRAAWFAEPVLPPALPQRWKRRVRAWDLAATEQNDNNDPDYTVGLLMGLDESNRYWILDVRRYRYSPQKVKNLIRTTADADGADVHVMIEKEPAASGKIVMDDMRELLKDRKFEIADTQGDKVTRAYKFSAACERGEVWLAAGAWVKTFLGELTQFPAKGVHDDQVDGASSAFNMLAKGPMRFSVQRY